MESGTRITIGQVDYVVVQDLGEFVAVAAIPSEEMGHSTVKVFRKS